MSILRALEKRGADPTLPWGNSQPPRNGELGFTSAGVAMNDDQALSVTTVGTCIRLLADGISTLPFNALKKTKDRSKKIIDPAPTLVSDPWPEGTREDFFTQVMVSLLLRGNFYGKIVDRDSAGYATCVRPLHPDKMMPTRDPKTGQRVYRHWGAIVPLDDMVHIRSPLVVPGDFVGLNPVEYQRRSWALAAASETYGAQFYANSANPSGALEVPGDLTEEETLELARAWKQAHQGLGNANLPAVLTGGATWKTISVNANDAQFLETRTFQRGEIASWFGIPPRKIGIQDRSPAPISVEEEEMQFVTDGLRPWATRIEAVWAKLMRPSQIARFDFSDRLRGNTLQRVQAGQISVQSGLTLPDEWRAGEDLEPLPNGLGQVLARPMNMSYFDAVTGELVNVPDPSLSPVNPSGNGQGGGNPDNSPKQTGPDK